jgi:hypothetical protein
VESNHREAHARCEPLQSILQVAAFKRLSFVSRENQVVVMPFRTGLQPTHPLAPKELALAAERLQDWKRRMQT